MINFHIFIAIPYQIRIYHQFSFLLADPWSITINHISKLKYKIVKIIRLAPVQLESQQTAIVFYHPIHQGRVCELSIIAFITNYDQYIRFIFMMIEHIYTYSYSRPASKSAIYRLQLFRIFSFGREEIKHLHIIRGQFTDRIVQAAFFIKSQYRSKPECKTFIVYQN